MNEKILIEEKYSYVTVDNVDKNLITCITVYLFVYYYKFYKKYDLNFFT